MKKNRLIWLAVGAAAVFSFQKVQAAELWFYTDFDTVPSGTYNSGDLLVTSASSDVTSGVTGIYFEVLGGDGVVIKQPDGTDGPNYPPVPGPQGGKAMLVDGGGKDEGINVEVSAPLPPDDFTVEVVYWSSTNNIAGNTAAIQTFCSSEWPSQQYYNGVLRIVGDKIQAVGANIPQQTEAIAQSATITAATWHTVQYVFDLNAANYAQSTVTLYLDGAQVAQTPIDVSAAPPLSLTNGWDILGSPNTGARTGIPSWRFTVACSTNRLINGSDNRGLQGAIDAVAISRGALTPGQFVLPAGYTPPIITGIQAYWTLYD